MILEINLFLKKKPRSCGTYIYIYIVEYYSAIKRNKFESVLVRWMSLEPVVQSEIRKRKTNIVY